MQKSLGLVLVLSSFITPAAFATSEASILKVAGTYNCSGDTGSEDGIHIQVKENSILIPYKTGEPSEVLACENTRTKHDEYTDRVRKCDDTSVMMGSIMKDKDNDGPIEVESYYQLTRISDQEIRISVGNRQSREGKILDQAVNTFKCVKVQE